MHLTEEEKKLPICFECFLALGFTCSEYIEKTERWQGICGFCGEERTLFPVSKADQLKKEHNENHTTKQKSSNKARRC